MNTIPIFRYRTPSVRRRERMEQFLYGVVGGTLAVVLFLTFLSWRMP